MTFLTCGYLLSVIHSTQAVIACSVFCYVFAQSAALAAAFPGSSLQQGIPAGLSGIATLISNQEDKRCFVTSLHMGVFAPLLEVNSLLKALLSGKDHGDHLATDQVRARRL